jgi:hypothetical protein
MIWWSSLKPGEFWALYWALKERVEHLSKHETEVLGFTSDSGHLAATRFLLAAAETEKQRREG